MPLTAEDLNVSQSRAPEGEDITSVSIERDGDWFVAVVEGTNLASQGETVSEALANLSEVIELHRGGGTEVSPDEESEVLEELGIDPDEVAAARAENDGLPEFMQ